jgi:hypothetical protein
MRKHWIWSDPIKFKWWVDMLLEVNHKDQKVLIGGQLIECNRGQSLNSLLTWSKRWRTNVSAVRRFLKLLESDAMIVTENVTKTTRITICKYETYNGERNGNETEMKRKRNASETLTTPNNNDNNDNKIISAVAQNVKSDGFKKLFDWIRDKSPRVLELREQLTEAQYQTLIANYTKQQIADGLIEMHNWKPLLTKKVSAYRTLLSFIKNQKRDAA